MITKEELNNGISEMLDIYDKEDLFILINPITFKNIKHDFDMLDNTYDGIPLLKDPSVEMNTFIICNNEMTGGDIMPIEEPTFSLWMVIVAFVLGLIAGGLISKYACL